MCFIQIGLLHTHLEEAKTEFIKKDEWPPQTDWVYTRVYAKWDSLKDKVNWGVRDKLTKQALKIQRMISEDISGRNK